MYEKLMEIMGDNTLLYLVDVQGGFVDPRYGELPVSGAMEKISVIDTLIKCAEKNSVPIYGSCDRHFGTSEWAPYESELKTNGGPFDPHCMDGTDSQKIMVGYGLDPVYIENCRPGMSDPKYSQDEISHIIHSCRPIIFEKQSISIFPDDNFPGGNAYIDQFLESQSIDKVIIAGFATEYCVREAAMGFKKRGYEVYIISDAIAPVDKSDGELALDEMRKMGINYIINQ